MKTYKCIFCNNDCIFTPSTYGPYCHGSDHKYNVYFARYDLEQVSEEVINFGRYFINYQFIHPRTENLEMRRIFISDDDGCITVPVPGISYENRPLLISDEDVQNFLLLA